VQVYVTMKINKDILNLLRIRLNLLTLITQLNANNDQMKCTFYDVIPLDSSLQLVKIDFQLMWLSPVNDRHFGSTWLCRPGT